MTKNYRAGLEVLGDGFDLNSILNMYTGGMLNSGSGGKKQPSTEEVVKKALEEQRRKEQETRDRLILYSVLGVVGAGLAGTTYLLLRKKK